MFLKRSPHLQCLPELSSSLLCTTSHEENHCLSVYSRKAHSRKQKASWKFIKRTLSCYYVLSTPVTYNISSNLLIHLQCLNHFTPQVTESRPTVVSGAVTSTSRSNKLQSSCSERYPCPVLTHGRDLRVCPGNQQH